MIKSEKSHAHLGEKSRNRKADKLITILNTVTDLKQCDVLDIGTGSGHITQRIAKQCKSMTSVDLYDERLVKKGYKFKSVPDEHLPFKDNTFDVVISNHVIEHVSNQKVHFNEAHRVLKKGGIYHIATPNRLWFMDPHYKLPFITWLPRSVANTYLQLVKKKDWDIYPLTYYQLKKMAKNKFKITNISLQILKHPKKFRLDIYKPIQPLVKLIPAFLLSIVNYIIPTYVLALKKK